MISFYLNSKNNLFHIYCGLELFYLIVTKFEFELERAEFNQYFDMYHSIILYYFSQLSTKQSMDEIERKCYAKIIKILIKSCQISIPLSLLNNFDIVFSYILTYTQSDIKIIKLKFLNMMLTKKFYSLTMLMELLIMVLLVNFKLLKLNNIKL